MSLLDETAEQAMLKLKAELGSVDHDEDAIKWARIAASLVGTWSRVKQAENGQAKFYFTVAKTLSESPEELKDYVRLTLPSTPIAKLLPTPKQK